MNGSMLTRLAAAALALGGCRSPPAPAPVWREPFTGMAFLYVAPARFRMGSAPVLPGRQDDETLHEVTITRGFYLGRDEVTQEQWERVMGTNPSQFPSCGPRCPVETVSFLDVERFVRRLEARSSGSRFRLPTEAEWELACRAGTSTAYSTGDALTTDQANFDARFPPDGGPPGRFRGSPAPVGSYPANPWGFRDLHGNVWEWCQDWYGPYPGGAVRDPRGPATGALRVIRGGSWAFDANSARCALRYTHPPEEDGYSLGFRLVREVAAGSR
jgi:sulfatase modifying factor 1